MKISEITKDLGSQLSQLRQAIASRAPHHEIVFMLKEVQNSVDSLKQAVSEFEQEFNDR